MRKKCTKCGENKPLSEFYKHPRNSDGHFNKCSKCSNKDTSERYQFLKATDPLWHIEDRARNRAKQQKRKALGKTILLPRSKKWRNAAQDTAVSKVKSALRNGTLKREPCIQCGSPKSQAHHDDYSRPLDVTWLCLLHHKQRHVQIRNAIALAKIVYPLCLSIYST